MHLFMKEEQQLDSRKVLEKDRIKHDADFFEYLSGLFEKKNIDLSKTISLVDFNELESMKLRSKHFVRNLKSLRKTSADIDIVVPSSPDFESDLSVTFDEDELPPILLTDIDRGDMSVSFTDVDIPPILFSDNETVAEDLSRSICFNDSDDLSTSFLFSDLDDGSYLFLETTEESSSLTFTESFENISSTTTYSYSFYGDDLSFLVLDDILTVDDAVSVIETNNIFAAVLEKEEDEDDKEEEDIEEEDDDEEIQPQRKSSKLEGFRSTIAKFFCLVRTCYAYFVISHCDILVW